MTYRTFPAVRVTIHSGFANIPANTFRSYVRLALANSVLVLDPWGYELRVSPAAVEPLGYDITAEVIDGKLVTRAVCIVDPSIDGPTLWDCPCAECCAIVRDHDNSIADWVLGR